VTCKVTFLELSVFQGILPLASGYMEACCRKDPRLAAECSFEKISLPVQTGYDDVLAVLQRSSADVYAFSCYVWNAKLVRRLVTTLRDLHPHASFVLGGPQVMHNAQEYIDPGHENVYVCNGEGERTFPAFLAALLWSPDQLPSVRGLSFYRDRQLITTEAEPRITDLSEIPSPFLEGLFDLGRYTYIIYETNRGCPFKCSYCYWGAAIGGKVFKYDEQRIQRELELICKSGCLYLFIADANWGMLPRDVELTRFLVDGKLRHGAPRSVYFCSSKNTPERVTAISKLFSEGGMISVQPVSLQTMSEVALTRVDRSNIKTSAYTTLQTFLNDHRIASYIEMIWPLPGETLASWRVGLAELCDKGADMFVVYPLLLMNNVALNQKVGEYGLVTIPDTDASSEAQIVVATKDVDADAYDEGLRYLYAVYSLWGLRGMRCVAPYLARERGISLAELFAAFAGFAHARPDHPYSRFCERSIRERALIQFTNLGDLAHTILHADRVAFEQLLVDFARSQRWWSDPLAQALFEIDLVNRPHLYRNTEVAASGYPFAHLSVTPARPDGCILTVPSELRATGTAYLPAELSAVGSLRARVVYRRGQLPYMPRKSLREHHVYAADFAQSIRNFLPQYQAVQDERAAATP
jgi:hypothetical protein